MFICVIFLIVGIILYYGGHPGGHPHAPDHGGHPHAPDRRGHSARGCGDERGRGGVPQKGVGEDVFFDIYKSPLRDDRCMTGGGDIRGAIPINVSTQGCDDAQYRQVGILTRIGGSNNKDEETILPLMGRPLFSKRDKWNFYTLNDKNNMIKLPVKINGKSGTSEYGCDNVYNGDTIYVEGYNAAFKFTTYENQVMRYLPNSL